MFFTYLFNRLTTVWSSGCFFTFVRGRLSGGRFLFYSRSRPFPIWTSGQVMVGYLLGIFILVNRSFAFDLCPACSPQSIVEQSTTAGYMLEKNKLSLIGMYGFISDTEMAEMSTHEVEKMLIAVNYGIHNRIKIGLMYGFSTYKPNIQLDWLMVKETEYLPHLILGVGSFRGIVSESKPYLIGMKNITQLTKVPVNIAFGVKYSDGIQPVGNLVVRFVPGLYAMLIFEGGQIDLAMYKIFFDKLIVGMRMVNLKTAALGIVYRL